ncbi:hypothetical protein [Paraburkholderia youngii]|uniref:Uncharacterized protein n=1 Tax=Paraburkholderia youngii TaxID=2782701 RepID=A0A7W8LFG2_9BURK|nr:hypothetical protein [Paraburkholderia youngii]MBB5405623.1 hypothetical protein [Paraburkholderia youngii]
MFATVNIPGGLNNCTDVWFSGKKPQTPDWANMTARQATEVANRTQATIDWLNNAFDQAEAQKATALVIAVQADMWNAENLGNNSRLSEYAQYVDIIARRTAEFGKPVLVINGDTHLYQSDKPLMPNQACVHENAKPATQVYASIDRMRTAPQTQCARRASHARADALRIDADAHHRSGMAGGIVLQLADAHEIARAIIARDRKQARGQIAEYIADIRTWLD